MDIKLSHCQVTVRDYDEALAFYRDVIGLKVNTDVTMGNFRWLTMSPPSQPDLQIILSPPEANAMASPEDQAQIADLMTKGTLNPLIFHVTDCDAVFGRIQAAGAEVMQEPTDQPYGVRDCAFRDPSGTMLRFSQEMPGH